jgi:hypothetical protein
MLVFEEAAIKHKWLPGESESVTVIVRLADKAESESVHALKSPVITGAYWFAVHAKWFVDEYVSTGSVGGALETPAPLLGIMPLMTCM